MLQNVEVITHSCIKITGKHPAVVCYFDPYDLAASPHDADVIFVTHDHYDHYSPDDILKVLKGSTVIVAPASTLAQMPEELVPQDKRVCMAPGDVDEVCGIPVEAVSAYNVGKDFHPRQNGWVGYVVTIDDVRYYVAGDTDANDDNKGVECDVALIPAGGTYTFDADEAAAFANLLHPKTAIPTHYGTVVGDQSCGEAFRAGVDPSIEVELKLKF